MTDGCLDSVPTITGFKGIAGEERVEGSMILGGPCRTLAVPRKADDQDQRRMPEGVHCALCVPLVHEVLGTVPIPSA